MTLEIERININETKMPELQKCAGCKCKMLLSYFDIIENTGQLKKTCRKCLERNKINHDLVKYGKSVIYKIFCKDENIKECYVGSTIDLNLIKSIHKNMCNNEKSVGYNYPVYRFIRDNGGFDNWNFLILENYPCRNKEQLLFKERYWFEKLGPMLNERYPVRSEDENKEYNKQYREKNIEKEKERRKQYYEVNKEKEKQYYEKNREKILEKGKEKVECPCGSIVNRSSLSQHKKSQKHQNYLKSLS